MRLSVALLVLSLACLCGVEAVRVTINHAPLPGVQGLPQETDQFFWCAVAHAVTHVPHLGLYQGAVTQATPRGNYHWFVYQPSPPGNTARDKKILSSQHIHLIPAQGGWIVTPKSKKNKDDEKSRVNFLFRKFDSFQHHLETDYITAKTSLDKQEANAKKAQVRHQKKDKKTKTKGWEPEDLEPKAFTSIIDSLGAAEWMKTWFSNAVPNNAVVDVDIGQHTFQPAGLAQTTRYTITSHTGAPLVAPTSFTVDC